MKRVLLLLVILVVALVVIVIALRQRGTSAPAGVASLLPADTALLIHIPDLEDSRAAWHRTDLYQLYQEKAVQDFLQKPKSLVPRQGALTHAWRDAAQLRMRDGFLATNTCDALRLVGGFEFRCSEKQARDIIEQWQMRWLPNAQHSTTAYAQHTIDIITTPRFTLASVITGKRFFAATRLEDLKDLLDRIDRHAATRLLEDEQNFRTAMKQMPGKYALLLYVQPKQLAEKLLALRAQSGRTLPAEQQTLLERIKSISHAMVFDGGKVRDVDFVAMPRVVEGKLTRDTLALASADTLLYIAAIVNLQALGGDLSGGATGLQTFAAQLSSAGITGQDFQTAFGNEVSLITEWPASARVPTVLATVKVRDRVRASRIVAAVVGSAGWETSTRNGADFFVGPALGILSAVHPVIAISDELLVGGLDPAYVEGALSPATKSAGLIATASFRNESRLVPEPQQMFAWLDLAALYSRLDTSLQPLLQIGAAFLPTASEGVELSKLPPADVVTRHLSPVVASQSYVDEGYRAESVGPITLDQTVLLAAGAYGGSIALRKHAGLSASWRTAPAAIPTVPATPVPSATP